MAALVAFPLILRLAVAGLALVGIAPVALQYTWSLYAVGAGQQAAQATADAAGLVGAASRVGTQAAKDVEKSGGLGGVLLIGLGAIVLLSVLGRR